MPRAALPHLISEFLGVVFFAIASVWLIALVTYDPTDAVWFFNADGGHPPMNLAGLAGAFLAEASFQIFGLASYLVPVVLVVAGWYYFWCLPIDAAYTKLVGSVLLFGCSATLLTLAIGTVDVLGKTLRAGGYVGESLAGLLAPYLNRAGSIIVLLALLSLAVLLVTQFSFGRLFLQAARALGRNLQRAQGVVRQWWAKRRRDRQRRDVVRKHLEKAGASTARAEVLAKSQPPARAPRPEKPEPPPTPPEEDEPEDPAGMTPMLPLEDLPLKTSAEQHNGSFVHPPLALLDSPKAVQKFDEHVLMDNAALLEEKCREFSVAGTVAQFHPRSGGHHVRVQARRRRQVQQGDPPCRRSQPRDAGRIGAHRAHSGKIDRRHTDPEPGPRRDLDPRTAGVGRLPALVLEADAGPGQVDPR